MSEVLSSDRRRTTRRVVLIMGGVLLAVALLGCTSEPPKPAATSAAVATAAPAKAPEPTIAAAAPAKKVDYPQKGKSISLIVPYAPGGGADLSARLLGAALEKELGVPVEIVNKAGAGTQVGVAFALASKPDGYTVGYAALPAVNTVYLDAERKATFTRKDFQPVALHLSDPAAMTVAVDSPFKTAAEVFNTAKDKPNVLMFGTSGLLSSEHLEILQMSRLTGAKFKIVPFEGSSQAMTALLGGHVDVVGAGMSSVISAVKGGKARVLASFAKGGDQFVPGVKSMEELGFKGGFYVSRGYFVPAGTPTEIVDILSAAMKKVMETDEHKARAAEIAQLVTYKNPKDFAAFWDDMDTQIPPLLKIAREELAGGN